MEFLLQEELIFGGNYFDTLVLAIDVVNTFGNLILYLHLCQLLTSTISAVQTAKSEKFATA